MSRQRDRAAPWPDIDGMTAFLRPQLPTHQQNEPFKVVAIRIAYPPSQGRDLILTSSNLLRSHDIKYGTIGCAISSKTLAWSWSRTT